MTAVKAEAWDPLSGPESSLWGVLQGPGQGHTGPSLQGASSPVHLPEQSTGHTSPGLTPHTSGCRDSDGSQGVKNSPPRGGPLPLRDSFQLKTVKTLQAHRKLVSIPQRM